MNKKILIKTQKDYGFQLGVLGMFLLSLYQLIKQIYGTQNMETIISMLLTWVIIFFMILYKKHSFYSYEFMENNITAKYVFNSTSIPYNKSEFFDIGQDGIFYYVIIYNNKQFYMIYADQKKYQEIKRLLLSKQMKLQDIDDYYLAKKLNK